MFTGFAILLSVIVAIVGIRHQWRIAARRAALQVVLDREVHEPYFAQLSRDAYAILSNETQWRPLTQVPLSKEATEKLNAVQTFLNHYEVVAIAIRRQILDEDFYAAWARTVCVRHWKRAEPFIEAWKKASGHDLAWSEFTRLADRWSKTDSAEREGASLS